MTLPFRQKVLLLLTFGVAIFVILVDLTRMAFLEHNAIIKLREHHFSSVGKVGDEDHTCLFSQTMIAHQFRLMISTGLPSMQIDFRFHSSGPLWK